MNAGFAGFASSLGAAPANPLWRGALNSLAGRQLRWVYPAGADDDEFLKRATLASTLFLDGLLPSSLRELLKAVGKTLHHNFENPPATLGSRNLLQRATLVALLIENFQPGITELPMLVMEAEGKTKNAMPDLQAELEKSRERLRDDIAPLAFLYDLRLHGGLAHPPNKEECGLAAIKLGLPGERWHRTDFLRLLGLIAESIHRISEHFEAAAIIADQNELL